MSQAFNQIDKRCKPFGRATRASEQMNPVKNTTLIVKTSHLLAKVGITIQINQIPTGYNIVLVDKTRNRDLVLVDNLIQANNIANKILDRMENFYETNC